MLFLRVIFCFLLCLIIFCILTIFCRCIIFFLVVVSQYIINLKWLLQITFIPYSFGVKGFFLLISIIIKYYFQLFYVYFGNFNYNISVLLQRTKIILYVIIFLIIFELERFLGSLNLHQVHDANCTQSATQNTPKV